MATTWIKIKKSLSDGYQNISDKTGEMTRIGRLKIEMIALKRDIEKAFIELGGRVYHGLEEKHKDGILDDLRIQELVNDIRSLESKLKILDKKIDQVREHRMEKTKEED